MTARPLAAATLAALLATAAAAQTGDADADMAAATDASRWAEELADAGAEADIQIVPLTGLADMEALEEAIAGAEADFAAAREAIARDIRLSRALQGLDYSIEDVVGVEVAEAGDAVRLYVDDRP